MVSGRALHRCRIAAAVVLLGGVVLAHPALAEVGRDEAAARLRTDFQVEVLRVRPGEINGTAVWLVTVMSPGGNSNNAYMVTTLAVDRKTGALVPAFYQGRSGAQGLAGAPETRSGVHPRQMKLGTWR